MTVDRLISLLKIADPEADVRVSDCDSDVACCAHIMGVTINNNGSADILFNYDLTDEDVH